MEIKKKVNEMTKKDFESIPYRKDWSTPVVFNSMVIIPGKAKDLHDSGYRCMDFVAIKGNTPICRLSGCSDVIHIDGIGGYGDNWLKKYGRVPNEIPPSGWSIDCLPKSGLLRIWPCSGKMKAGSASSSFEIYSLKGEKIK